MKIYVVHSKIDTPLPLQTPSYLHCFSCVPDDGELCFSCVPDDGELHLVGGTPTTIVTLFNSTPPSNDRHPLQRSSPSSQCKEKKSRFACVIVVSDDLPNDFIVLHLEFDSASLFDSSTSILSREKTRYDPSLYKKREGNMSQGLERPSSRISRASCYILDSCLLEKRSTQCPEARAATHPVSVSTLVSFLLFCIHEGQRNMSESQSKMVVIS
ncbi:uncharacterized protein LOC122093939 [Macadamia integrifolia]|uniref:uncharacterized protein LOC122093939 n=1 Tax=Macadamia integrifolia TaxID=60698 RepID=UPI001C52B98F|nr:uncharacterized protein LOC122093939 [Macadamia integrifolia]